ncbi:MAG: glycosyltransferase family 39 protein [Anaerolineae bacterium]|nr:glycosyltransferase family 39 protein [Anaerolineae bacterium]
MTWAILAAIVLVGAMMRTYRLGTLPLGLYHDEAFNGQDAWRILQGNRPIFFAANNGREPLFLYAMSLAMAVWGRTPFAVRVAAAVLGTLTVPATFAMTRALFGERAGLWSAALIAVAPWPVNLSRIGLRAVSMPFVVALSLWLWWSGRGRQGRARTVCIVLAGVLMGLSWYTYTAARLVFVALAGFALFQIWIARERLDRSEWLSLLLPAVLATAPLLAYGVTHWELFAERTGQVSILNPAINDGDPLGMLAGNVLRAAGLFVVRGDAIPRHNVPLRPLFDPLASAFFVLGVLLCVAKSRRESACALSLIWTAVMLAPTVLAEDCPHFLRAVGVLPVAAVFPAVGLEWAHTRLAAAGRAGLGRSLIAIVLVGSAVWGGYDYFVRHAGNAQELGYAFEADQLQEAVEINRFLGTGWQAEGLGEPRGALIPGRHVYLGPRMWENRIAVNLLVASPEQVSILGRDPVVEAEQVLALAWPHGDMGGVRQVLPWPSEITVWAGPLERGDLDAEPRLLYVAFRGDRLTQPADAIARFEGGIELLSWGAAPTEDGGTHVQLRWRTTAPLSTDYTVTIHLDSGGAVIAQDDRAPGAGYYPTTWWRPGDEIVDTHVLDVPFDPAARTLWVGWYELGSMQRLRVLDRDQQPGPDQLILE